MDQVQQFPPTELDLDSLSLKENGDILDGFKKAYLETRMIPQYYPCFTSRGYQVNVCTKNIIGQCGLGNKCLFLHTKFPILPGGIICHDAICGFRHGLLHPDDLQKFLFGGIITRQVTKCKNVHLEHTMGIKIAKDSIDLEMKEQVNFMVRRAKECGFVVPTVCAIQYKGRHATDNVKTIHAMYVTVDGYTIYNKDDLTKPIPRSVMAEDLMRGHMTVWSESNRKSIVDLVRKRFYEFYCQRSKDQTTRVPEPFEFYITYLGN